MTHKSSIEGICDPRQRIKNAIAFLRTARIELRIGGAGKAADAVARALKSAEGALRHAEGMANREAVSASESPVKNPVCRAELRRPGVAQGGRRAKSFSARRERGEGCTRRR